MLDRSIKNKLFTAVVGVSLLGLLVASVPVRAYAQQSASAQAGAVAAGPHADVGWLGVGIEEVTANRAQELKLPAVHGVFLANVGNNSPAAKAGLQKGDVVTEYNGQRVEGVMQFRRLVRETPPSRQAQLTVWRAGHSVMVTVTVGSVPSRMGNRRRNDGFAYGMPRPGRMPFAGRWWKGFAMPDRGFAPGMRNNATPLLGVSAQDLSGQLGAYFGAPDDEGVLVTDVHQGSAAEKAGIKAGDVITQLDGQPVRNIGELRSLLREKRGEKSVTLSILRKGTEMSINVSPEQPEPPSQMGPFHRRIAL